jgi:DNA-binding IclR family transcriptional regulator
MASVGDLATILGAAAGSASRALAAMKRGKIITRIAARTYRCDLEALSC